MKWASSIWQKRDCSALCGGNGHSVSYWRLVHRNEGMLLEGTEYAFKTTLNMPIKQQNAAAYWSLSNAISHIDVVAMVISRSPQHSLLPPISISDLNNCFAQSIFILGCRILQYNGRVFYLTLFPNTIIYCKFFMSCIWCTNVDRGCALSLLFLHGTVSTHEDYCHILFFTLPFTTTDCLCNQRLLKPFNKVRHLKCSLSNH